MADRVLLCEHGNKRKNLITLKLHKVFFGNKYILHYKLVYYTGRDWKYLAYKIK